LHREGVVVVTLQWSVMRRSQNGSNCVNEQATISWRKWWCGIAHNGGEL
jgi:hypothetical protein